MSNSLLDYPLISSPINNNGYLSSKWYYTIKALSSIKGDTQTTIKLTVDGLGADDDLNINPQGSLIIQGFIFNTPSVEDYQKVVTVDGINFTYGTFTDDSIKLYSTGHTIVGSFTTAPEGWLLVADGTTVGSGNEDERELFIYWYNDFSNTICPVSGGRGSSAEEDFEAGKSITAPRICGRLFAQCGAGSGLTSRTAGDLVGTETVSLTAAQGAPHAHEDAVTYAVGDGPNLFTGGIAPGTLSETVLLDLDSDITGNGDPHNNMQPTLFINMLVKL